MSTRIPPYLASAPQPGPREFWIQLENHPWDLAPSGRDRMTGRAIQDIPGEQAPELVTLKSPTSGTVRQQLMYKPLKDALVYRKYTKDWAAPDDHKVNPWDLNELDPTDEGTMGTIPGAVLHLVLGDGPITVHFRNLDMRADAAGNLLPVAQRTHSIHPHGVVFAVDSDGAYPLSPPSSDPQNSIAPGEAAAWAAVGVTGPEPLASNRAHLPRKLGDRVPPGGTFTYSWETMSWPTTAGVWLYHDHSIFGDAGTLAGAIGIIVVHNVASEFHDPEDFYWQDLPDSSTNGHPVQSRQVKGHIPDSEGSGATVDAHPRYRKPPAKALYLQLYHELSGMGMCINGRQFLGNTPTLIAGSETLMRFGVLAMNPTQFHTFHIHGHRWVIRGPQSVEPAQNFENPYYLTFMPQVGAVSQFEDTRVLGPATSFVFAIREGQFLGANGSTLGEWYMHCHVPAHMMAGMTGSLLVVDKDQVVVPLAEGTFYSDAPSMPAMGGQTVHVAFPSFDPQMLTVSPGATVNWINDDAFQHTITSDQIGLFDINLPAHGSVSFMFSYAGVYSYHCQIHPNMTGSIMVM
jgi:plastocyanin